MKKIIIASILSGLAAVGPSLADQFRWPLDIEISPSSSFCESRGWRFHGGIDIRTRLQTGFPVKAPADGFVSRVKVQWRGFGYALYVDHPQLGVRSVYGHLDDFAGPVAAYVAEKLKKMKARYGIDDSFGPDRFPVKKGQVIAFTGETGLGPAHLHFELRRFNDDPITPAAVGLTVPDRIPPVFLTLYVDPLSPETRINGGFLPAAVSLKRQKDGTWSWDGVPVLEGKSGFSVGLVDNGEGGNKFGIEHISIAINGKLLLRRSFNQYAYDENSQASWIYDYPRTSLPGAGYVYTMFRWPFETLRFSEGFVPWSGALGDAPGSVEELTIEAVDFGGNRIVAKGRVDTRGLRQAKNVFDGMLRVRRCHYTTYGVVAEAVLADTMHTSDYTHVRCTDASGGEADLPASFGSGGIVQVAFPNAERWAGGARCGGETLLPPHVFVPVSGGTVTADGARVVIPAGALNFPILARLDITDNAPRPGGSAKKGILPAKSPIWQFSPPWLVTAKPIRLEIDLKGLTASRTLGVYEVDGNARSYSGGEGRESTMAVTSRCLRPSVVLEDTVPPVVTVKPRRTVKRLGLCAVFGVDDTGEGVDYESARATVNGETAAPDSDPDKDEIYVPIGPGKTKKNVVLTVSDNAGNPRTLTTSR